MLQRWIKNRPPLHLTAQRSQCRAIPRLARDGRWIFCFGLVRTCSSWIKPFTWQYPPEQLAIASQSLRLEGAG